VLQCIYALRLRQWVDETDSRAAFWSNLTTGIPKSRLLNFDKFIASGGFRPGIITHIAFFAKIFPEPVYDTSHFLSTDGRKIIEFTFCFHRVIQKAEQSIIFGSITSLS
jgi:hypothetical protein